MPEGTDPCALLLPRRRLLTGNAQPQTLISSPCSSIPTAAVSLHLFLQPPQASRYLPYLTTVLNMAA